MNLEELESYKKDVWLDLINEFVPKVLGRKLKVLDIGTGPGFLAIVMASCGYEVVAVDYTEAMLEKARYNASNYKNYINFKRMNAHNLNFKNRDITYLIGEELRQNRRKLQMIFQDPSSSFNSRMKIEDIVSEPLLNFKLMTRREALEETKKLLMRASR